MFLEERSKWRGYKFAYIDGNTHDEFTKRDFINTTNPGS
jgi:hypothetical protein